MKKLILLGIMSTTISFGSPLNCSNDVYESLQAMKNCILDNQIDSYEFEGQQHSVFVADGAHTCILTRLIEAEFYSVAQEFNAQKARDSQTFIERGPMPGSMYGPMDPGPMPGYGY